MRLSLDGSLRGLNLALTSGALTGLSGAATTYSTSATAITFLVNGAFKSKSQVSGGATPTTDGVDASTLTVADTKKRIFVWCLDATGTVKVVQGKQVSYADVANGSAALEFPEIPDTLVPFAYVAIKNASGAAFNFGSTNWNTANITIDTVVNVAALPPSPVTS